VRYLLLLRECVEGQLHSASEKTALNVKRLSSEMVYFVKPGAAAQRTQKKPPGGIWGLWEAMAECQVAA